MGSLCCQLFKCSAVCCATSSCMIQLQTPFSLLFQKHLASRGPFVACQLVDWHHCWQMWTRGGTASSPFQEGVRKGARVGAAQGAATPATIVTLLGTCFLPVRTKLRMEGGFHLRISHQMRHCLLAITQTAAAAVLSCHKERFAVPHSRACTMKSQI